MGLVPHEFKALICTQPARAESAGVPSRHRHDATVPGGPRCVLASGRMAKPLEYNATLTERVDITDALTLSGSLLINCPPQRPWFVPGQYCVLASTTREARARLGPALDVDCIGARGRRPGRVLHPLGRQAESDNPLTHLLWKIQTGARLYMLVNATGKFTVKDTVGVDDPRLRVMVAAGTGSAPFLCMLRSELRRDPAADLVEVGAAARRLVRHRPRLSRRATADGRAQSPEVLGTVSPAKGAPAWNAIPAASRHSRGRAARRSRAAARLPPVALRPRAPRSSSAASMARSPGPLLRCSTRGFVPDFPRIRRRWRSRRTVMHRYSGAVDTEPVINLKDPNVVEPLRARMQAGLARL